MKKVLLPFLCILLGLQIQAQETYLVQYSKGITIRSNPDAQSDTVGKLPFGFPLEILEEDSCATDSIDYQIPVIEEGWVKIKIPQFLQDQYDDSEGYVPLSGLRKKAILLADIQEEMNAYHDLVGFEIAPREKQYLFEGDFFQDGEADRLFLAKNEKGKNTIVLINYNEGAPEVHVIGANPELAGFTFAQWKSFCAIIDKNASPLAYYGIPARKLLALPTNS